MELREQLRYHNLMSMYVPVPESRKSMDLFGKDLGLMLIYKKYISKKEGAEIFCYLLGKEIRSLKLFVFGGSSALQPS